MLKYLALIPALIVEGPITTVLVGALSSPTEDRIYNVVILFFLVVFADLFGDIIYYSLGRYAGSKIIKRFFEWRNIPENNLNKLQSYFKKYGGLTIVLAKISHGLGWPVIVLAGSVRMFFPKFILYATITSVLKSAALVGIGYYIGKEARIPSQYLMALVAVVLIILISKYLRAEKKKEETVEV